MKLLGFNIPFPFFTRNRIGESFYDMTTFGEWTRVTSNMHLGLNHPILSPALLFISKLFSQAEFKIVSKETGKVKKNHRNLPLLKRPNYNQTFSDLLETLLFTQMANGVGVIWKKTTFGTTRVNSLYVIDFSLIEFPETLEIGKYPNIDSIKKIKNTTLIYDKAGENIPIKIKDLMFFYDMPNGVDPRNAYNTTSRLDGIRQTLYNTVDSEIAKSIIIKSNGKEMISGVKEGFPLTPGEKTKVEDSFNNSYGLGALRKRGLITNASLKWDSLHIIMRDLGHDEGIKTDAGIIFAALHLPSDVYSIAGAKSTYKNANQSLVSYIQNEMIPTLQSFINTINDDLFKDDIYEIEGSYSHLPVMLEFSTIKIDNAKKQGEALTSLRTAGIPDKLALELVGLPEGTDLKELPSESSSSSEDGNQLTLNETESNI